MTQKGVSSFLQYFESIHSSYLSPEVRVSFVSNISPFESFVGRKEELVRIKKRLTKDKIVNILGASKAGKLVKQAALFLQNEF